MNNITHPYRCAPKNQGPDWLHRAELPIRYFWYPISLIIAMQTLPQDVCLQETRSHPRSCPPCCPSATGQKRVIPYPGDPAKCPNSLIQMCFR